MRNYTDIAFAMGLCGGLIIACAILFICLRQLSKMSTYYEEVIDSQSQKIAELVKITEENNRQRNLQKTSPVVKNTTSSGDKPWVLDIAYCGPRGYKG